MALSRRAKYRITEIALLVVAAISAAVLIINLVGPQRNILVLFLGGLIFTGTLLGFLRILLDPDRVRASQSDAMLTLASETLGSLSGDGLNTTSAQQICSLLLPATTAMAVAITDQEKILGYAGRDSEYNTVGLPIRTPATHAVISAGKMSILRTQEDIGLPASSSIHAAIIAPLSVGEETIGTLKFYYPSARSLNETEESIALGFAELLSTQAAAQALEEERELATSMELKVLQSQINPHFLFNTINTIAALIRTDPDHARELLRDFATFYRSTLENSSDLITLGRELEQTTRYLGFEIARFGEEKLQFSKDIEDGVEACLVPAFMIQPLVENAVRHGRPAEGTLHIQCCAQRDGADLNVYVEDDGVGMSAETKATLTSGSDSEGLGIAMRNIQQRICRYYGPDSFMQVESAEGKGTKVHLFLKGSCKW